MHILHGKKKNNSECCFVKLKNDRLICRCRERKEKYKKTNTNRRFNQKVSKCISIFKGDLNKFILLLRKGVYPYEDMDNWEKFDETTLPPKEAFYSNLNLEDISDEDYAHAQKVWDVFEIKI